MDDTLHHYCKNVVRSPLPIFLTRRFTCLSLMIYISVQWYTCNQLAKWRLSQNQLIRNGTNIHDAATNNSSDLTNVTSAIGNLTMEKIYHTGMSNSFTNSSTVNESINTVTKEIKPLYGHAMTIPFMMIAFQICVFVCRVRYQSVYTCAVQYVNLIDAKAVIYSRKLRSNYQRKDLKLSTVDEEALKSTLTLKEHSSFFAFTRALSYWKPTVNFLSISYPTIDCTLVDYMFSSLQYQGSFQIIGAIEIVYEVMKAIDYLHYRNVYHLDLRPDSVKLHCNGRKVYVKLTNFNFMKKSVNKNVSSSSVGLRSFYRPPECFVKEEVDPEKVDIWGLGMIVLELFTGGLYRISCESRRWDGHWEVLVNNFLNSTFPSYLEGAYGVVDMFHHARYNSDFMLKIWWYKNYKKFGAYTERQYPYRSYNVKHSDFLADIKNFVCRLLKVSPWRRITLQRAFEEPLILNRKPQ